MPTVFTQTDFRVPETERGPVLKSSEWEGGWPEGTPGQEEGQSHRPREMMGGFLGGKALKSAQHRGHGLLRALWQSPWKLWGTVGRKRHGVQGEDQLGGYWRGVLKKSFKTYFGSRLDKPVSVFPMCPMISCWEICPYVTEMCAWERQTLNSTQWSLWERQRRGQAGTTMRTAALDGAVWALNQRGRGTEVHCVP